MINKSFLRKKTILFFLILQSIFILPQTIYDLSRLSPTKITTIVKPNTINRLQETIGHSNLPISFAGGRFSQGGQIAYPNGIVIDMTGLNKIISFNNHLKTITVQPGITWKEIQEYIDPYNLSVQIMQSYNDFTVGGSLSVNAHSRDPLGSIIKTVLSIKIILANGSHITATRNENSDLFYAAFGGYGLLGAITEVTLQLTENIMIEKVAKNMNLSEYTYYFFTEIYNNSNVIFHNANLYPNDFESIHAITWYKTNKSLTNTDRLQKQSLYIKEKTFELLLRRLPFVKNLRKKIEKQLMNKNEVVYRNYEMSYSTKALEPIIRWPTTSILQEYFIPLNQLLTFLCHYKQIIHKHKVNILNLSIRYVPQDNESILSYAPNTDCFALVSYINVPHSSQQTKECLWTQELINAAISVNGTFYLPYHLYANSDQFKKAYPQYQTFLKIKKKYDPENKFRNCLYKKYMEL